MPNPRHREVPVFTLRSSAFQPDAPIPRRHTCDGDDRSPPLAWSGPPPGAVTYTLIVDDPDAPDPAAPKRVWVHWLLYNLPAGTAELADGAGNGDAPEPARHALTDANALGYRGPCPPIGRHRYFFRLAALDCALPELGPRARRADLERAMHGHVLATAVLMGTYDRSR
jgi:Raf kinase inhibitor-like YbhB/YbcL family protein